MKKLTYISTIILLLGAYSCQKMDDLRINPNNVSETHPQLLLTQIAGVAFQVGGINPLYASRMMVITDIEAEEQWYKWNRGSFDDYNNLRNVNKMLEEAKNIDSDAYRAIAKVFKALYFYNLTLTFGDIPYTDALKGETEEVFTPQYDSQKEVFKGILAELEEANTLLTGNEETIDGDIIYYASNLNWRKFVNSFRLKVLLTLSNKTSESDFDVESTFAGIYNNQPVIESLDESAQLVFADALGSRYGGFNDSRYASAVFMDSTFVQRLVDREDPRVFIYCDQTKSAKEAGLAINDFSGYAGGNPIATTNLVYGQAAAGNISLIRQSRYTQDPTNEPHMVLGYPEVEFILAEASVRGWISSDAKTHYENGVKASFEFYKTHAPEFSAYLDASKYLAGNMVNFDMAESAEEKIERIIMQKYLQSFLQGGWNSYFENLRTGYPGFLSLPGLNPPTRWMYPTSEFQNNLSNVEAAISIQYGGNDDIRAIPWWLK